MEVRCGDIVFVDLDPTERSEQRGTRLFLVVQNNVGNASAPTSVGVSFTVSFADELYPFEVLVTSAESRLEEDSVALCSQLQTVSIDHRITTVVGSVPDERLDDVDTALEYSLGLRTLG